MNGHRRIVAAMQLLFFGILLTPAFAETQSSRELRVRAEDFAYNLDHDEAFALLRKAVAVDPGDSANHRALATAIWLDILFERGAVTVDHYLGSFNAAIVRLKQPPPEMDAEFKREIGQAIRLAERHTAAAPRDARAHFDLGTALGLQATYVASVEGHLVAGFRLARRSYEEEQRVLELDPQDTDAGLIIGTYRYIVSTLSLPMRLTAYVVGFGGGKERGLRMVEETAAGQGENRTDAQFALVLLYNRERRYDEAMRVLSDLRREYPRNRLVLLEAGATEIRAHRPANAETLLTQGIGALAHDARERIPGEEALWHYKRGAARVMLGRREDALTDLRVALSPDTPGWVQGRAHVELARLAQTQGDHASRHREAEAAVALCEQNADPVCVSEAKALR